MFAPQEKGKGGQGAYNPGFQGGGTQYQGGGFQFQPAMRPPMPEAKITSNGRYNRDSSETIKLVADWPMGESVVNGKAGIIIEPAAAAIRLNELIPLLPLSKEVDDATFSHFKEHLGTFVGKHYPSKDTDKLWEEAGMPLMRPNQPATVKLEEKTHQLEDKFDKLLNMLGFGTLSYTQVECVRC